MDFPQPDSPTTPSVSPAPQVEGDAVDGLHVPDGAAQDTPLRDRVVLDQSLGSQDRPHLAVHRAPPRRSGTCWSAAGGDLAQRRLVVRHTSWTRGQRGWNGQPVGHPQQVGRQALDGEQLLTLHVQPRDRLQQALGVGVAGAAVQVVDVRALDDRAGVHHRDPVGDVGDHAEVVGDQDQAHLALLAELGEQVHDLGLDGHVQRGGRLVGDQHRRVERERHRDHDALPHAAGELVRVVVDPLLRPPGSAPGPSAGPPADLASERFMPRCTRNISAICQPTGKTGFREDSASWKIIAISGPRTAGARSSGMVSRSRPRKRILPWGIEAGRHVEDAHDRLRGHGLAGARLAEHGQRLPASRWR